MYLPIEIRLQVFRELWALKNDMDHIGGEQLAAWYCVGHYFMNRRARYRSTLDSLGLSSTSEDYSNSVANEVLDHPVCILPAAYKSPGGVKNSYIEHWSKPLRDIQGLYLLSRSCLLGSQSFARVRSQDFQRYKKVTYLVESWDYGASVRLLLEDLPRFRVANL
jgi:hypothetical protein